MPTPAAREAPPAPRRPRPPRRRGKISPSRPVPVPFPQDAPGAGAEAAPRSRSAAQGRLTTYLRSSAERAGTEWVGRSRAAQWHRSGDTAVTPAGTPPGRGERTGAGRQVLPRGRSRPGVPDLPAERRGSFGRRINQQPPPCPSLKRSRCFRAMGQAHPCCPGRLLSALPPCVPIYAHLLQSYFAFFFFFFISKKVTILGRFLWFITIFVLHQSSGHPQLYCPYWLQVHSPSTAVYGMCPGDRSVGSHPSPPHIMLLFASPETAGLLCTE